MIRTSSGASAGIEGRQLRFQRLLLAWFRAAARPLAWRRTRDPYAILVSEIMLQQTQAERVEPFYETFLQRFPDVRSLAAASRADVLRAWGGLGYNRRAVNLHQVARTIVERHDGRVPSDLDDLLALPGVGAYTARAVMAFAFGTDAAPVDVNVARILARAVSGQPMSRSQTQHLADELVPAGQAGEWTSALMDLGAHYCTSRVPRCGACPVAATCAWRGGGSAADEASDPAKAAGRARAPEAFAGSDRYHRGRLVDTLRRGPVDCDGLPQAADLDDTGRLVALTRTLVDDGLAEWNDGSLQLPES